jgi:hypothetical protein
MPSFGLKSHLLNVTFFYKLGSHFVGFLYESVDGVTSFYGITGVEGERKKTLEKAKR